MSVVVPGSDWIRPVRTHDLLIAGFGDAVDKVCCGFAYSAALRVLAMAAGDDGNAIGVEDRLPCYLPLVETVRPPTCDHAVSTVVQLRRNPTIFLGTYTFPPTGRSRARSYVC
jgi:hypothetical protein